MRRALLLLLLVASCKRAADDAQLVDVRRDDLVIGVEVTGELAAVDSTDVRPPPLPDVWMFKIANIAAEGDDIKAGAPVIAFDAADQMRTLETMANESDAAQKKLQQKRDDAALARRDDDLKVAEAEAALRKAVLKAEGSPDLVASVDLQTLALDAKTAQLVLDGAKNHAAEARASDEHDIAQLADKARYAQHRVEILKQNVGAMQVMAPRDGTVVLPVNWQGEKHKVGDSVWVMENILQIVGLGQMVGNGQIDEVDLARVAPGQHVSLRLDALPDVQLAGTVHDIARAIEAKSNADPSKVAKLKIDLAKTAVPLRPGMRFRGQVETDRRAGAIVVPVECVFVEPDGPVAYRASGRGLERVTLVLGKRSQSLIEVVQGLQPGDRVSRVKP